MRAKQDARVDAILNELAGLAILGEMSLPPGSHEGSYHPVAVCKGSHCPFHNPSDHHMKDWPMVIRASGLTERVCPHGIGHPDPDSLAWMEGDGYMGFDIHGCDGCCAEQ